MRVPSSSSSSSEAGMPCHYRFVAVRFGMYSQSIFFLRLPREKPLVQSSFSLVFLFQPRAYPTANISCCSNTNCKEIASPVGFLSGVAFVALTFIYSSRKSDACMHNSGFIAMLISTHEDFQSTHTARVYIQSTVQRRKNISQAMDGLVDLGF